MQLVARTLTLGICLAVLAGCSSAPPAASPSPTTSASPTPVASPSATASASPSASSTPSPTASSADTAAKEELYRDEKAGFQVMVPAGWKTLKQPNMLVISTADESFLLMFLTQSETYKHDVTKDLDKLLANFLTDITNDGPGKDTDTNGMKTVTTSGTGKMGGKDHLWSLDVIQSKQAFVMVTTFDPKKVEPHKDVILKVGASIQPIKD